MKTFLIYLSNGLSVSQVVQLLTTLEQQMRLQIQQGMREEVSTAYRAFRRICPTGTIAEAAQRKQELAYNQEAIFLYMRMFIRKQIVYYPQHISSNGQNLHAMCKHRTYGTGTPGNSGAYPPGLLVQQAPGTLGNVMDSMNRSVPPDGIHRIHQTEPLPILQEVLSTFFQDGSSFRAILDVGAMLRGVKNRDVAASIVLHVREHFPNIEGVVFFERSGEGPDHLMIWHVHSNHPVEKQDLDVHPERFIAYYDQLGCFGTDLQLPFNAKGVLLWKPTVSLSELLQTAARLRKLGHQSRLESGALENNTTQELHIAMPPTVFPDSLPTLREIFLCGMQQEANGLLPIHYRAAVQAIHNICRNAALRKILAASSVPKIKELSGALSPILIHTMHIDPIRLYGGVDAFISPQEALQEVRSQMMSLLEHSKAFSRDELLDIADQTRNLTPSSLPEKVRVHRTPDGDFTLEDQDLDQSITMVVSAEQEQEEQEEQEQHMHQHTSVQSDLLTKEDGHADGREYLWSEALDPQTEWLQYQDPSWTLPAIWTSSQSRTPPLFQVHTLVSRSPSFASIAKAFPKTLWMSNNFLPTVATRFPAAIGDRWQRQLLEVLVVLRELPEKLEIESIGCLTQADAAFWRRKLSSCQEQMARASRKIILADVALCTPVAGYPMDLESWRRTPELASYWAMLKFLDGQLHYTPQEKDFLKFWIKENGVIKMESAFSSLCQAADVRTGSDQAKNWLATDIGALFETLRDEASAVYQV